MNLLDPLAPGALLVTVAAAALYLIGATLAGHRRRVVLPAAEAGLIDDEIDVPDTVGLVGGRLLMGLAGLLLALGFLTVARGERPEGVARATDGISLAAAVETVGD